MIPSQVLLKEMHLAFAQVNSSAEHSVQQDESKVSVEMPVGSQLPKEILSLHVLFIQLFGLSTVGVVGPGNVQRSPF